MLQATAQIVRRRWTDLGLIGAANLVAQLVSYLIIAGILVPVLFGYMGARRQLLMPGATTLSGMDTRELIALAAGAAGLASIVIVPVALASSAFMLAGMLGAVARLRQGERVGFITYWSEAARGFGRAFGVTIAFAIGAIILLVLIGGLLIALMPWNFVLWGLLAIPATLYFLIYPTYLSTVEGMGIGEAFRMTYKALVKNPGEAALAGLTLLVLSIVYSFVVGLLVRLGFLGQILVAFVQLLAMPALTLYLVERFETRVRGRAEVGG